MLKEERVQTILQTLGVKTNKNQTRILKGKKVSLEKFKNGKVKKQEAKVLVVRSGPKINARLLKDNMVCLKSEQLQMLLK